MTPGTGSGVMGMWKAALTDRAPERVVGWEGLGLARVEQAIGRQEQLMTQPCHVHESAIKAGRDPDRAAELLRLMEVNLARLHAWRLRLLSLQRPTAPDRVDPARRRGGRSRTKGHDRLDAEGKIALRPAVGSTPAARGHLNDGRVGRAVRRPG